MSRTSSSPRLGRSMSVSLQRMPACHRARDLLANLALDDYRDDAERFSEEIDREYYLHYSGRQESFEIEEIYERHAELFSRRPSRSCASQRTPPRGTIGGGSDTCSSSPSRVISDGR